MNSDINVGDNGTSVHVSFSLYMQPLFFMLVYMFPATALVKLYTTEDVICQKAPTQRV